MRTIKRLGVPTLLLAGFISCTPSGSNQSDAPELDARSIETFLQHMSVLSSDEMGGRRPGTAGYDSAAAYIARESRAIGLEPGGAAGSYLQPIHFRQARVSVPSAEFTVAEQALTYGSDYTLSPRTATSETDVRAPMIFAGFGISAPDLGYDDFEGIDVEGKLVVVVPGAPDAFGPLERTVLSSNASRDSELRARGARGVVIVGPDELEDPGGTRVRYVPPMDRSPGHSRSEELEVSVTVPRRIAAGWMTNSGHGLVDVLASLRAGESRSFDFPFDGHVRATFEHQSFESSNVAALLPGSDSRLRNEVLVLSAHLDHLGTGLPVDGDSIYNGTLDNASGSAALLTLASTLGRLERPRRSILFLWVTAEESGLLGSEYFARFPSLESGRVVANQNMDGVMGMITAATDVLAFGYEHSNLSEAVDYAVGVTGTPVAPDPTPEENLFIRSDQYAFVREGIPAIWVQGGRSAVETDRDAQRELDQWIAERYHKPTDDLDQPFDLEGVRRELASNLLVTWYITNRMDSIAWDTSSFLYRRWVAR